MNTFEAFFLGLVQGITEFLPISSSGHLALLERFLRAPGGGLGFDILLHLGTLAALLLYFRRDWQEMGQAFINPNRYNRPERRLLFFLAVAVIPGALAGVLLEKKAETVFRQPVHIAVLLGSVGLLLILAERYARHRRSLDSLRLGDALLIGLSQALAIMPGVSRSGITMTMALFLGFTRPSSARFSFLLATPIIAGAGIFHIPKWFKAPPENLSILAASFGFLGAAVASYLTIRYLLRFLQRHTFYPFAYYRLILAAVILVSIYFYST